MPSRIRRVDGNGSRFVCIGLTHSVSCGAERRQLHATVVRPPGDDLGYVNRRNERRAEVVGDLLRQKLRLGETR